jgi:hypothetical protein
MPIEEKCRRVGRCRLPDGHRGLCMYAPLPPGETLAEGLGVAHEPEAVVVAVEALSSEEAEQLAALLLRHAAFLRATESARPH